LSARQIVNAQTSLASFPAGVLLLRISSPKIAPVVLKVCR
jgi:hypothetical protein